MDVEVVAIDVEFLAAGSKVAFLEKIEIKLVRVFRHMDKAEHPYVEFPSLEQQRSLNVLLNEPLRVDGLFFEVICNISYFREQLDSSALVHRSWLEDPLVLPAVLFWHILRDTKALPHVDFRESNFELVHIALVQAGGQNKCCREDIKCFNCVVSI